MNQPEQPKVETCPDCLKQTNIWRTDDGRWRFRAHTKHDGTTCPGSGKAVQKP